MCGGCKNFEKMTTHSTLFGDDIEDSPMLGDDIEDSNVPGSLFDVPDRDEELGLTPTKGRRICAAKFALTFPRCDKSPEEALAALQHRW